MCRAECGRVNRPAGPGVRRGPGSPPHLQDSSQEDNVQTSCNTQSAEPQPGAKATGFRHVGQAGGRSYETLEMVRVSEELGGGLDGAWFGGFGFFSFEDPAIHCFLQLFESHWLADVVVHTSGQASFAIAFHGIGGQSTDRSVP